MEQKEPTYSARCRSWTMEEIPVLSASWEVPELPPAAPRVQRRIQRFYRLQYRSFLRYCEGWLYPQAAAACSAAWERSVPLPQIQADLHLTETFHEGRVWSLYSEIRETGLEPTPLLRRSGDTWDLGSGYLLPLQHFLPSGRKKLLAQTRTEMESLEAAGSPRLGNGWRQKIRRSFDARRFYLTPDGLTWFYPQGSLTLPAAGIPLFTLPWGKAGLCRPNREPQALPGDEPKES